MGGKPDNAMESDRPESGGADKDMVREKAGLLDRDTQRVATKQAEERAAGASAQREEQAGSPSEFSIDNPRNPDPKNK
jgi:hypothetical protein